MKKTDKNNGKTFYVVQFLELPFENIDEYVCVPYSWIKLRKILDQRVVVAYPDHEDPLTTKNRVKNKERPNNEWRFYVAFVKYESDTYKDADDWITMRNDYKPCEEEEPENEIRGIQLEPVLNKKSRSASRPFFSGIKSDKPLLTVKPYKNPRKPLPRISIRLPVQSKLKKKMDTKRFKLDVTANPTHAAVNHTRIVSQYSMQKQSIVIKDNQLIQSAPVNIATVLNDKTSFEQTQPDLNKEDKSVMSDQSASPKLLPEKQPTSVAQNGEQALSLPVIDVDEFYEDDDHIQPEPLPDEGPFCSKTAPNTTDHPPQFEPMNARSTPLLHSEHSIPEISQQEVPAGQFKEANGSQRTELYQILTTSTTGPRPSSTPIQLSHCQHIQLPFLPANNAAYLNSRSQGISGGSSTAVTYNQQRPRSQKSIRSKLFTPYDVPKPIDLSAKLFRPPNTKRSLSVTKNLILKKTCLENIPRNISAMQDPSSSTMQFNLLGDLVAMPTPQAARNHFQKPVNNARSDIGGNGIKQSVFLQGMASSAAHNLSNLAQQSRSLVEQSHERQHLPTQEDHLQQIVRIDNKFRRPDIEQSNAQRAYLQTAMMNREFIMQSIPDSISQPSQLFPQCNNQYVHFNSDLMEKVLRYELLRETTDGTHTNLKSSTQNIGANIQFPVQNSSNQYHYNFKHPQQSQEPPKYQAFCGHPFKSETNSQQAELQGIIKRTQSLALPKTSSQLLNVQRGYSLQDPRVRARLNQNPTEHQILDPVAPGNITVEPEPTSQDSGVQIASLPDRSYNMQSALLPGDFVHQSPCTRKIMVDQTTETEHLMDVDHCEDENAKLSIDESPPNVVDSACQTDEYSMDEQGPPYQETDSDSDDDMVSEANRLEEHVPSESNREKRPRTPENLQVQQKLVAEQEMLNMFGTLFAQMGTNFSYTRDLFDHLRNSIIRCAETYEALLEKVEKFNTIEHLQISTSSTSDEMPGASENKIIENGNENSNIDVSDAPKINSPQRCMLRLPPEYDPNDSKWTLKYREKQPGLVKLIPRSNVYVNKTELKNCKRESKDCRTLARMLLTEVFSKNALSVCSLTGGKAKAFNSVNLDVRPGLDEHARIVLLTFVEEYGAKRGWKTTDTTSIISSIRTKIQEMRAKFGQVSRA